MRMNRRLKWIIILLCSGILFVESMLFFKLGNDMMRQSVILNRYIDVGPAFSNFAYISFFYSLILLILSVFIPLITWWDENGKETW